MAIKYSFVDSAVYGTDDINDITRSLTGAGVAPFVSKDSYNATDLNVLTSTLVEGGVGLGGCKCAVYNPGTADMSVTVAQGIVFFESGVRLTIDEEGFVLPITPNSAGYIYAHYSPSLQKADIVFSGELPTDGEYVILAEISDMGNVTDRRPFAQSKIATFGENVTYSIPESRVTVYDVYANAPAYSSAEKVIAEIDLSGIDVTKFNYLIYKYTGYEIVGLEKYFNFKNNQRASFYVKGSIYYHSSMFDIIMEEEKFVIVTQTGNESLFNSNKTVFKSAIPYFKFV